MPASIEFIAPEGTGVSLGEVFIPDGADGLGTGQPLRIVARNNGDTKLRNVNVEIEGEVSRYVKLALDEDDRPGVWTDFGGSLMARTRELFPGQTFAFWAVAIYKPEDVEGHYQGNFVLGASSVGV